MGVDSICFEEAMHLVTRSPKYWLGTPQMYLEGLRNPEQARLFRAAYFFARHIDDVLDGDRDVGQDPKGYVNSIRSEISDGRFSSRIPIVQLYHFVIAQMEPLKKEGDDPRASFERVIKAMEFDYERARSPRVLTKKELDQYFKDTFIPVIDLSLIILGSSSRAADIPFLVESQGHLYSIRDMRKDLRQKIINIPQEELDKTQFSGFLSYRHVMQNPVLRDWARKEVEYYSSLLSIAKTQLKEVDDAAKRVCFPLIRGMQIFSLWYRLTHSD